MASTAHLPNKPDKNMAGAGAKEKLQKWSFIRNDFRSMHRAIFVFLFCTIGGTALVIGSQIRLTKQLEAVNQAHMDEIKSREMDREIESEKRAIHDFQSKYVQLAAKGFIGPEKRLDWIEDIQAIQKNAALLPISYEIAEQQTFQVDSSIDTGIFELHGSKMLLKMNLLHEMDLLTFFNGLKASQPYDLQSCHIKRLANLGQGKFVPLLNAECVLYWITLDKRDENAISPHLSGR